MSELCQDKHSSHRIIKRLISRLKVSKQTNQTDLMNDVEAPVEDLEICKIQKTQSIGEILNDHNDCKTENSPTTFKLFCEKIEQFLNYIKDNENLRILYIHKYPQILQKQINVDVDELQNLLAEIKETITNIKKLKSQRKLIKKETSTVKKTVRRIKDDETRELESVISRYDRDLFSQWTKSKWKPDALEELMFDVQDKQVALESLKKLIHRYMGKLKDNSSLDEESEDNISSTDKLFPLTSSVFSFETKIPVPPPCPPILPLRTVPLTVNPLRNNSRLSWVQRRFRAERRGNFVTARPYMDNQENEPYVFPLNMNNNANGSIPVSNSNPFEFDISRFSCDSTETSSSTASNSQIDSTSTTSTSR